MAESKPGVKGVVIGLAVIVVIILYFVGKNEQSSPKSPASHPAPAVMLEQLDGSTDDATYQQALDAWDAKCRQTPMRAAGIVSAAYDDEEKHNGPDTSRLQVMRNLTSSVPDSIAPTDCTGVAAGYLVLVEH